MHQFFKRFVFIWNNELTFGELYCPVLPTWSKELYQQTGMLYPAKSKNLFFSSLAYGLAFFSGHLAAWLKQVFLKHALPKLQTVSRALSTKGKMLDLKYGYKTHWKQPRNMLATVDQDFKSFSCSSQHIILSMSWIYRLITTFCDFSFVWDWTSNFQVISHSVFV